MIMFWFIVGLIVGAILVACYYEYDKDKREHG